MEQREAGRLLCDFLSGRKIPEARLEKLSPADGESLADLALRFKVGGLFYREIKSRNIPTELIPVDVRNRLRDAYRNLATVNTSLFLDASKVLKSLADNQLPVIALKGLSLAKNIYGDIALRPMSDMDLLVKEEDLVRAGRILLALGYKPHFSAWESMLKTRRHLPPFTNKSGAMIELHWNIVTPDSPIEVDLDGLWERACLIKVDNVEVRAFSPEDLFLHLCIHAGHHLQTGIDLIPFCDMAGLIKTSGDKIDWQIVIERATRWGGQKCVYLMLLLVRELLGAAPPDKIMSEIKPDDYRSVFFDEALEQIFDVSPAGQLFRIRIGKLSKIKKVKGIRGKVLALLKGVFPSRENLARIYPVSVSSPKIYLCYLFRLGRMIVYYTIVLLRLFRRDQSVIKAVHQEHRVSAVSDWMFS
ncbi:MAG: nucleotidyltransferase family protein [Candidatus Aminicenantes bacterium]|nr:nucleotidyltransferase family protein [Candidatus Aminicenantes bacterium]